MPVITSEPLQQPTTAAERAHKREQAMVLAFAAIIFLGCFFSPPHLQDDVDAVQATIARNMIVTGDWVTPQLDGVPYLEKPPLKYWAIATSFLIFGQHDWAARLPLMISVIALCWVTMSFATWAYGKREGFNAGLVLATCVGLFLFTRILIVEAMLTLGITIALWAMLRALDPEEIHSRRWATIAAVAMAFAVLLKGLIGIVFPIG